MPSKKGYVKAASEEIEPIPVSDLLISGINFENALYFSKFEYMRQNVIKPPKSSIFSLKYDWMLCKDPRMMR